MERSNSIISVPKFKIENPIYWENHRGGWKWVLNIIQEKFHSNNGTLFLSAIEDVMIKGKPILEPWVGFIHQVPKNYKKEFPDLERLLKNKTWQASLPYCKGIFVLSSYLKKYLLKQRISVPINMVYYPVDDNCLEFDLNRFENKLSNKQVLFIGEYLRDYQSFFKLKAEGYQKVLLRNDDFNRSNTIINDSVKIINTLSDNEYDKLLSESIVFLKLFDAPANTTVVECIVRKTPLLINRLEGNVEYLGKDYPFYFSNMEEAERKIKDKKLIRETVEYLKNAPILEKITKSYFIESIENSAIYRSLPTPQKDKIEFKDYDLSIIMCSYKRVYNLENIFERFCKQDFKGTFEIILWNNNFDEQESLNRIYEIFKEKLNIKLIHSSENYYCVIRMAVTSLMRSDILLITDDDVLPNTNYISKFMEKYKKYGKDSIICCRGHEFQTHELDEANPHLVWETGEFMKFYDESYPDCQVHFLHADNTLIPKHIMKKALQYEYENYEYILVDDYFLSYVFSEKLKLPIWKIKADDIIQFTPCAESEEIALFKNKKVMNQRISFYIYHMRRGWPNSRPIQKISNKITSAYLDLKKSLSKN